jgi:hypothetical protein
VLARYAGVAAMILLCILPFTSTARRPSAMAKLMQSVYVKYDLEQKVPAVMFSFFNKTKNILEGYTK